MQGARQGSSRGCTVARVNSFTLSMEELLFSEGFPLFLLLNTTDKHFPNHPNSKNQARELFPADKGGFN